MTPAQYQAIRKTIGTQQEVAPLLGVSVPTIARREAPTGRITLEAAHAIRSLAARRAGHKPPAWGSEK